MKIYSNIYKFCAVALAAVLASCVQMEDAPENVGYLCSPGVEVDVTVEDLLQTKVLNVDVPEPEASTIKYVITDKNGKSTEKTGPWEPMKMPVGSYSISATAGTNGFEDPYFTGTCTGTIKALAQETPQLKMALSNSLVNLSVAPALDGHFTLESVKLEAEGFEPVTFAYGEIPDWYFVPAGVALKATFTGESSTGSPATFEHTFTPSAKVAYNVVCGKSENNLPTISLPNQQAGAWATRLYIDPATVSGNISDANKAKLVYEVIPQGGNWDDALIAEQISGDYYVVKGLTNGSTYSVRARIGNLVSEVREVTVQENLEGAGVSLSLDKPNGVLSGTIATLNLGLTGIIQELVTAGHLVISESTLTMDDKTVVRTASVSDTPTTMAVANDYPYLPHKSSYELEIVHKLANDVVEVSSFSTATAPEPDFAVTLLKSYSSYDYGVGNNGFTKNVTTANGLNAETIYDAGVTSWGISDALMSNSNYSSGRTTEFKLDGVAQTVPTLGSKANFTGLSWDEHKISAKVTFDGISDEAVRIHHITGLPYSAMPNNTDTYKWIQTPNSNKDVSWNYEHKITINEGTFWNPNRVDYYYYGVRLMPSGGGISTFYAGIYFDSFHIPQSVNVSIDNSYFRDGFLLREYHLICSGTTLVNEDGNDEELNTHNNLEGVLNPSSDSTEQLKIEGVYGSSNETSFYLVTSVSVRYSEL